MGVPKFYFWLSQRYPSINENVDRLHMPEFDNFYVDMNGVFHTCSHPSDDINFRLSEVEIFENISIYIEYLFNLVQPRKVFFLSVDGVAPRSKMNQQRSRRFKSAKEAIEREVKAKQMGEIIPSDPRFDSNCITPGTEFMHKLHEHIVKFLSDKIQHNNAWKNVEVIYSGYDVPGEGEHKIMDYIRYCKTQNKFSSTEKHCLYGLDADLIHLGLCTHEPYFSLLREKVSFGKNQKRHCDPFRTDFQLLHLSILRNYIYEEFIELAEKMKFSFDIEKIIDDWILINFLIGNDFLPHIPKFHILKGGIQILYDTYKEVIVQLDGYINQNGNLNLLRYQKFLEKLSEHDIILYDQNTENPKYMDKDFNNQTFALDVANTDLDLNFDMENLTETEDDSDNSEVDEFVMHKNNYYKVKLHFENLNTQVLQMANEYVKGIQWVLHYYYDGCISWNWYYPYYYGPFISDLAKFDTSIAFEYQLNEPFLPLVQLLAVIPQASRQILPQALQNLTCDSDSPIIDFFPKDVNVDLNEKIHDYEAIILIPFVDEKLFLKAFHDNKKNLTSEEIERNKFGHHLSLMFSETALDSTSTQIDVSKYPNVIAKKFAHDFFILPSEIIFKGLRKNVDIQKVTGFPSLVGIDYEVKIENVRSGMYSYPSMVLKVKTKHHIPDELKQIAKNYSGKMVYINWPLLSEAKFIELFDNENRYWLNDKKEVSVHKLSPNEIQNVQTMTRSYCDTMSRSKGIHLDQVDAVVKVVPIQSQRYHVIGGKVVLLKEWSNTPLYAPYDVVLCEVKSPYRKLAPQRTFTSVFTKGKSYFLIDQPFYGYKATVVEYDQSKNLVHAKVQITSEPDFGDIMDNSSYIIDKNYMNEYKMVNKIKHKLSVGDICVKRLLGSVLIEYKLSGEREKRLNVGLKLKYKSNAKLNIKPYCIPGYSMEDHNEIFYSYKVFSLFKEYYEKFPFIFQMFSNASKSIFTLEDAVPDQTLSKSEKAKKLLELRNWLSSLDIAKIGHFKSSADYLDNCIVDAIEETIESHYALMCEERYAEEHLSPSNFYIPEFLLKGNSLPDSRVKFYLYDRVVNIKSCMSVPYGAKGTVVGIYKANDELVRQDNEPEEFLNTDYVSQLMRTQIEVLFDEPFDGGLALRSSKHSVFKMHPAWLINITYGLINAKKTLSFRNVYNSIQYTPKDQFKTKTNNVTQGTYSKVTSNKVPSTVGSVIANKVTSTVDPKINEIKFNHSETSPFKILTKKQTITTVTEANNQSNVTNATNHCVSILNSPSANNLNKLFPKLNIAYNTGKKSSEKEAIVPVRPPEKWISSAKSKRNTKSTPKENKVKELKELKLKNLPIPILPPPEFKSVDHPNNDSAAALFMSESNDIANYSQMYVIPTLSPFNETKKSEQLPNDCNQNNNNNNRAFKTRQYYNSNYRPNKPKISESDNFNYDVPLRDQNSDVKRFVPLQVARNFQHERNVKLKQTNPQ